MVKKKDIEDDKKGIEQRFREWATGLRKYMPSEKQRSNSNGGSVRSAERPIIQNIADFYSI